MFIEGAPHVHGGGQCFLIQPEHAKALIIRKHAPRRYHVDEFRRLDNAHDFQGLLSAIDDGVETVVQSELVRIREAANDCDFIGVGGAWQSTLPDIQLVYLGLAGRRNRHQVGRHRFIVIGEIELRGAFHPAAQAGHTR